jgi:uncharacterized protein (DUF2236 family)
VVSRPLPVDALRTGARALLVAQLGSGVDHGVLEHGDAGWFGPGSAPWAVHADPALFIGGVTAVLHQSLSPSAMAAVSDHSSFRSDPWGRLHRTGSFLAETVYGSTEVAAGAVARVRAIHARIGGVAPTGVPYRADDPDLVTFIHAVEVDAFSRAYALARPYSTVAVREEYVAQMAQVAVALGAVDPPSSLDMLEAYFVSAAPGYYFGSQACAALRFVESPVGLRGALRPAYRALFDGACALLRPEAAVLLGLDGRRRLACRGQVHHVAASALRVALGAAPQSAAAYSRVGAL